VKTKVRKAKEWAANADLSAKKATETMKQADQSRDIAAYLEKHGFNCLGDALAKFNTQGREGAGGAVDRGEGVMTRAESEARLDLLMIQAKYDGGGMPPALFLVLKQIETDIAWMHHNGGSYDQHS
jgi:hypothetical protein